MAQAQDHVGSDTCIDCHADQAELWQGSHHALAWTLPGPDTVVGDFDGTRFHGNGTQVDFFRDGGGYALTVREADGVTTTYPVHSVAGIAPLQQYLIETEPGRLQSFDVVWDDVQKRWYHLYPDQDLSPQDGLHWSGPYKTWNARCAECHATDYQRNYDGRTQSYGSTQAEIGVGCEACHGPGRTHVAWAEDPGAYDTPPQRYGLSGPMGRDGAEPVIQTCAACHSRRENLGNSLPRPGGNFYDDFTLALLRPGLYHADGQILDEVYVYGSFLQSKMYAKGVSCLNCHDPHGADLILPGNATCTQCHSEGGNPDFPSLRLAEYDSPSHHHHAEGTQCVSCHMIERDYMGIDGRHDHSFRVPRPDLGAQIGAPDACTDCHADRSQEWAAAQIADWYPDSRHRGPHYGTVLAAGRQAPDQVREDLLALALNGDQPGIVRATALSSLQALGDAQIAARAVPLLSDADPLVRAAAAGLQRAASPQERAARLLPLLDDPRRSVRIAAVKQAFDLPRGLVTGAQGQAMARAMGEWQRSLATRLDFPETHLVLGGMALTLRNAQAAQSAFRRVVELDTQRAEAWPMLVQLTQITQGVDAAREVLREALQAVPDDPTLFQMWGELNP